MNDFEKLKEVLTGFNIEIEIKAGDFSRNKYTGKNQIVVNYNQIISVNSNAGGMGYDDCCCEYYFQDGKFIDYACWGS